MALIVENGTGLRLALSYASVRDADTYLPELGLFLWDGVALAEKQWALVEASETLDRLYRFPGRRLVAEQALEWPRVQAIDSAGRAIERMPATIAQVTMELAYTLALADVVPFDSHLARIEAALAPLTLGPARASLSPTTARVAPPLWAGAATAGAGAATTAADGPNQDSANQDNGGAGDEGGGLRVRGDLSPIG